MVFMRHPILHVSSFFLKCFLPSLLLAATTQADQFQGVARNFGKEQCVILDRFPSDSGAKYRANDTKKEEELCGISFDDKGIGMCPKPGARVLEPSFMIFENPNTTESLIRLKPNIAPSRESSKEKLTALRSLRLLSSPSMDNSIRVLALPTLRHHRFTIIFPDILT